MIAIAGVSAGHPWAEFSVSVAGGLVAYACLIVLLLILIVCVLPWLIRSGLDMLLIVGLAMVAVLGVLLGVGGIAALFVF